MLIHYKKGQVILVVDGCDEFVQTISSDLHELAAHKDVTPQAVNFYEQVGYDIISLSKDEMRALALITLTVKTKQTYINAIKAEMGMITTTITQY